ncbi:MAG: hypothetical protein IT379_23155 [Deltaproteobacteria bacterium]|nr:hypothetical protein [Deltaproteobacteria bacterium]
MTARKLYPYVLSACLLGAAVSAPALAQILSPGELSRAHASLEGDSQCGQCHSSGRRVDTGRCLACHRPLAARIRAGQGLHGRQYRGRDCGSCHVEHHGRGSHLIRWPGGGRDRFDHAQAGWPLTGGHAGLACNRCHTRGGTFLGASRNCASCHRDPHAGRFGGQCGGCHDETAWARVRLDRFDHGVTSFPLRGQHANVRCNGCHRGDPPRWRGVEHATCGSCHADPHRGRLGGDCANCHTERGFAVVERLRQNHPGLSLAGGHQRLECNACHDRGNVQAPSRGSACVSCHRPVHEASFGRACNQCHSSIRWLGLSRRVGLAAHARTEFPLRGRHEEVDCAGCHPTSQPPRQRFRQLRFGRCLDCHADRHAGEFADRAGGECAACHDERGFRPTRFGVNEHAGTRFPLRGLHEAVPCGGCHRAPPPRLDLHVSDRRCAACHENPHGTQFAAEMRRGGCAQCHSPAGWGIPNMDHRTWPLTGAHSRAACAACHGAAAATQPSAAQATTQPSGLPQRRWRGVPRRCDGCHDDPHAGQFRLTEPRRACDRCHATTSFEIASFPHARITGFELEGRHARAECGDCHPSTALRDDTRTVRWRLGYRSCADCHANPHERRRR